MKIKLLELHVLNKRRLLFQIMRAFIFLFCSTLFALSPNKVSSQKAKIKVLSDRNVTIDEMFGLIRSQTDYTFVYNEKYLVDAPTVLLKKGTISADRLLKKGLAPIGCTYEFLDDTIIVKKMNDGSLESDQQEIFKISGKVTDENGIPIPGATIYVSSTEPFRRRDSSDFLIRGTSADFEGNFDLEVSLNQWLVASALGFELSSQLISTQQEYYEIVLSESASELDEVVLVGYGTRRRGEVTAAISSVKGTEIQQNNLGTTSFDRSLSGLIKGVQVLQNSGTPGSGVDINIRGITSPFNGSDNNPLFVIDGVPFQADPLGLGTVANPLLSINPNDIESIDVLKDASATAIYGSRGANGVILVNTKKGRKGEDLSVTFSTIATFAEPINLLDYANTSEWRAFNDQIFQQSFLAAQNGQIFGSDLTRFDFIGNFTTQFNPNTFQNEIVSYDGLNEDYFGTANTNWADEVFRNIAYTQQYNATITGGTEKSNMLLSFSYANQEGLVKEESLEQFNVRLGIDSDINSYFRAGANINLGFTRNENGYDSDLTLNNSSGIIPTLNARPDIAPFDTDGQLTRYDGRNLFGEDTSSPNPLTLSTQLDNRIRGFTALGNIYVEVEPLQNLKLRSELNASRFQSDSRRFDPQRTLTGQISTFLDFPPPTFQPVEVTQVPLSILGASDVVNTNYIYNLTTSYLKTLGDHSLSSLLGFAWDRSRSVSNSYLFQGFPDDDVLTDADSAEQLLNNTSQEVEIGLNSLFARVAYNYASKYFLTVNFRTDKSVRFAPSNRRAYFPSVSASWAISNEKFLSSSSIVDNLRLRVGAGRTGSNNIPNFAFLQFFGITNARGDEVYNGQQAVGLNGTLPNPEIQWELTEEVNLGLDFTFFNNRIRGSIDVYDRKTEGALMPTPFLLESGATAFTSNFADLTNKGFEIDFGGDIIRNENLTWSLNLNVSKNENTLDRFSEEGLSEDERDNFEIGREINFISGYQVDGIIQTQVELDALNGGAEDGFYQEPGTGIGDYKYVDLNGDDEITPDDVTYLGSGQADFFGGFNSRVQYKGFEFSTFFNFAVGGEAVVPNDLLPQPDRNVERRFLDRWTPTNTDAVFPRAVISDPNDNRRLSNAFVHSTSFLRLKNVQLKYNFPIDVLDSIGLKGASIFVAGTNLWTLTDFPGIDPELLGGFATGAGNTNNPYPLAKSWSLGLNIQF